MTTDETTGNGEAIKVAVRTPPYVSFRTFLTLLEELQTNGIPPQVDRSILSRFAGGLQGQLMSALKALDLMTDDNIPKSRLREVVKAFQTDSFKTELDRLLRDNYPYVFALNLMDATPAMFAKAFSDATDAKEDVLRKCRTFFLHAAKEAEVPLGPRIQNAKFPRSRAPSKKKTEAPKPPASPAGEGASNPNPPPSNENVVNQLLGKFPDFDPSWNDEIKAKWFAGFDKFMSGIKDKGG